MPSHITYRLTRVSLTLDVGYIFTAAPAKHSHCFLPWTRGISSGLPLMTLGNSSIHGHHQLVNTEIRLTTFFAAKDGEALYSQQKQDWELTVAQIMNSICQIQT